MLDLQVDDPTILLFSRAANWFRWSCAHRDYELKYFDERRALDSGDARTDTIGMSRCADDRGSEISPIALRI
jgi:hypothetical protein